MCFLHSGDIPEMFSFLHSGDAYMVVSGLPNRNGDQHSAEVATFALDMLKSIHQVNVPHRQGELLKLRAGIHTGKRRELSYLSTLLNE